MILIMSFAAVAAVAQPQVVVQTPSPPVVTTPVPPRAAPPIRPRPSPPALPLPEPGPAARELALRIVDQVTIIRREAHRMVLNQLRWGGGAQSCSFDNTECSRIAEEIAAREAPQVYDEMRSTIARAIGAQFERTMTAAQIEEATRFFSSDAGRSVVGSFMSIDERTFAGLAGPFSTLQRRRSDLADEFARRTQHLPRGIRAPAPPPRPRP